MIRAYKGKYILRLIFKFDFQLNSTKKLIKTFSINIGSSVNLSK